uniref:Plakophilin 4 n=1 Tax=Salarias fasciatus TaxID=181472 RepID=A0A672ITX8_SALFA
MCRPVDAARPARRLDMEDYDVRSAASILASVKEQEARFEQLTRALEEERRNVTLQLERANLPPNPPHQPTTGMAASGDAGKRCQPAGSSPPRLPPCAPPASSPVVLQ